MEKHFVLVHSGCFGAWIWYKVVTLLKSNGHKVTAIELAASGINPKGVNDVHSISDYSEPLIEFLAALPSDERVILVAHSLGGFSASWAMEKFPQKIAVAVFIAAPMPSSDITVDKLNEEHSRQMESFMDSKFEYANGHDKPPTSIIFGPEYLATMAFQLSPPEDLTLATLLMRPISGSFEHGLSDEGALTKENYGSVRRVYFMTEEDKATKVEIQKWLVENNPPEEVKQIRGSDHMAMLSQPLELFACLEEISKKYE